MLRRLLLTWPLPALWAWGLCWLAYQSLLAQGAAPTWALGGAAALGGVCSLWGERWWRRVLIAAGFPLSLALSLPDMGAGQFPAWAWLLPALVLLLVYPINAWRDAPLFPTPPDALLDLPTVAPLPAGALVLDAGCGLGHGLVALRRAYPQALLHGLEYAWLLRILCALRCRWATVRQGDIWQADWSTYDLVYLFQRPESMPRAAEKLRTMRPGSWMVSLDFEATDLKPQVRLTTPAGKALWVYRA